MATSNSKDFTVTRAEIIEEALINIGVYDAGEDIDGADTITANRRLNLMVKHWAIDTDIFLRTESTLFLQPNTQSYALSTDEITDEIKVDTTLSAAEASGQTVISVTTSSGATAADRIGIKLDDNTIHWTTIVTVDSATQVTITTATTGAAASGNRVYIYTTKSSRPQKILFAFRRDINDFDTEISIIGENDYRMQSNKKSDGPPVEVWYNPQGNQATGKLHVWPDNGGKNWDKIILIAQHLPDDFDASNNNADFPSEWELPLIWGLSAELASGYGASLQEISYYEAKARSMKEDVMDYDVENSSVVFAMGSNR